MKQPTYTYNDSINSVPFTGHAPGTIRFIGVTAVRPPWWRRLWNFLNGRPSPRNVTYRFVAAPPKSGGAAEKAVRGGGLTGTD
jgi:hypothetical protein